MHHIHVLYLGPLGKGDRGWKCTYERRRAYRPRHQRAVRSPPRPAAAGAAVTTRACMHRSIRELSVSACGGIYGPGRCWNAWPAKSCSESYSPRDRCAIRTRSDVCFCCRPCTPAAASTSTTGWVLEDMPKSVLQMVSCGQASSDSPLHILGPSQSCLRYISSAHGVAVHVARVITLQIHHLICVVSVSCFVLRRISDDGSPGQMTGACRTRVLSAHLMLLPDMRAVMCLESHLLLQRPSTLNPDGRSTSLHRRHLVVSSRHVAL